MGLSTEIITTCKLYIGWRSTRSRQDFEDLLNLMKEDWKAEEKFIRFKMLKKQRLVRFMVKFSFASCLGCLVTYLIYLLNSVYFHQTNDIFNGSYTKTLIAQSELFFDTQNSLIYEIVCHGQLITAIIPPTIYSSYDGFFVITVYHLCAQLSILKLKIRDLITDFKEKNFEISLKPIVQKHLQLKRYNDLKNLFKFYQLNNCV